MDLEPWIPCQIIFCYKSDISSVNANCNNAWWPLEAATFKSGNIIVDIDKVLKQA